jgi:lipid-binding SYLF domain-containing protein
MRAATSMCGWTVAFMRALADDASSLKTGNARMGRTRRSILIAVPALLVGTIMQSPHAQAASGKQISADADRALRTLYATQVKARDLGKRATAILVFPKIVKAGLIVGGQSGDGALRVGGRTNGYYNISAASFGLQAGAETFSYAMFFMTGAALKYLQDSDGWSIGSGPSVVVVDKGAAASLTSTTLTQDVYAFPFGQRGLMAGLGLEGSKITHIRPGP